MTGQPCRCSACAHLHSLGCRLPAAFPQPPTLPCRLRCTLRAVLHSAHHNPLSCPALQTPLNALRFAQLCNEAGIPAGTINVSSYCALLCCVVGCCTCVCAALCVALGCGLHRCGHGLANASAWRCCKPPLACPVQILPGFGPTAGGAICDHPGVDKLGEQCMLCLGCSPVGLPAQCMGSRPACCSAAFTSALLLREGLHPCHSLPLHSLHRLSTEIGMEVSPLTPACTNHRTFWPTPAPSLLLLHSLHRLHRDRQAHHGGGRQARGACHPGAGRQVAPHCEWAGRSLAAAGWVARWSRRQPVALELGGKSPLIVSGLGTA